MHVERSSAINNKSSPHPSISSILPHIMRLHLIHAGICWVPCGCAFTNSTKKRLKKVEKPSDLKPYSLIDDLLPMFARRHDLRGICELNWDMGKVDGNRVRWVVCENNKLLEEKDPHTEVNVSHWWKINAAKCFEYMQRLHIWHSPMGWLNMLFF